MSASLFKVVFRGELLPGFALDTVKANLAALFRRDLSSIEHLFAGKPVVLKRALNEAEADSYLRALRKAGAEVQKEPEPEASPGLDLSEDHDEPPAASGQAAAGDQMICPKCGQTQLKADECANCGLIIEKYIARQKAIETTAPTAAMHPSATPVSHAASPYSPPQSAVGEALPEFGELRAFSIQGRIGRLRYLAWSVALTLIMAAGFIVAFAGYMLTPALGVLLIAVAVIAAIVVGIQISVQRLHDIGWSGWLCLLALIPYLGSLFNLVILLIPGSKGANRFGAPPPENSRAVKILAVVSILVPVVFGILAAIAIPQYQTYVERTQQAEQQMPAAPEAGE